MKCKEGTLISIINNKGYYLRSKANQKPRE